MTVCVRACVSVVVAWVAMLLGTVPEAGAAQVLAGRTFPSPQSAGGTQSMDVYLPSDAVYEGGYTVILLHSGGYCCGSRDEMSAVATLLADRGYGVVNMSYTLAVSVASFPKPVSEVFNAVRWVRTEGQALGMPDRVVVVGFSAGATIAMTAATASAHPDRESVFASLGPAPLRGMVIDGAIDIAGRCDIAGGAQFGNVLSVMSYVGKRIGDPGWETLYQQASAVAYVNACAPPMVVAHGDADTVVPVLHGRNLASVYRLAGAPVRENIIAGGVHSMSILGPGVSEQVQWLDDAIVWVRENTADACGRSAYIQTGACCPGDGTCVMISEVECLGVSGGGGGGNGASWRASRACVPMPCQAAGACCAQTMCLLRVRSACDGAGGIGGLWRGQGVCTPDLCSDFFEAGACCRGTTCQYMVAYQCVGENAMFTAGGRDCNSAGEHASPCKFADFNKSQTVTVQDVFDYLSAWFRGDASADIEDNGQSTPGVQSIFTFLGVWFVG